VVQVGIVEAVTLLFELLQVQGIVVLATSF